MFTRVQRSFLCVLWVLLGIPALGMAQTVAQLTLSGTILPARTAKRYVGQQSASRWRNRHNAAPVPARRHCSNTCRRDNSRSQTGSHFKWHVQSGVPASWYASTDF